MARILAALIAFLMLPLSLHADGSPWSPIGPYDGSVFKVAIDPVHPGVLYAVTYDGVIKSLDSGASWSLLAGSPAGGVVLEIDSMRPRTIYASDDQRLYKSTDGGARWVPLGGGLPVPLSVATLAADPSHPSRLYLGAYYGGLWRSTDGGASWKPGSRGLPLGDRTPVSMVAVPGRPSGTALAVVRSAYPETPRGIFRTTNGGYSWTRLSNAPEGYVWAFAVSPSEPRTLYVSVENQGLYRSSDGGGTWTPASGSVPLSKTFTALAVDPRSSRIVYAGTTNGLMKTTNGGRHWEPAGVSPSAFVGAMAVDPRDPEVVYAGVHSSMYNLGGIWRSRDAGRHWERRSQGILGVAVSSIAVDAADPRALLVGADAGLFRTTNGGRRWVRIGMKPAHVISVQQIAASPVTSGTFFAMGRSLWKTVDGGGSWTEIPQVQAGFGRVRFDPADPDVAYVLTRQQLFRGTVDASPWAAVAASPMPCSTFDFAVVPAAGPGPSILYVAGTGTGPRCSEPYRSQILRSTDGGLSWQPADAGLPGEGVFALAADPLNPEVLYTGIGRQPDDPVPAVWKSLDGGASWSPAGEELLGASIISLLALPTAGHVWAVTREGKAFLSTDAGESWQEQGQLQCTFTCSMAFDPRDPERIYAGTSKGVWMRTAGTESTTPGSFP
jgi:photosystem II stability/assembly factor-like uncharacterized protein